MVLSTFLYQIPCDQHFACNCMVACIHLHQFPTTAQQVKRPFNKISHFKDDRPKNLRCSHVYDRFSAVCLQQSRGGEETFENI